MTFQERAERLLQHPDTVTVTVAGEDRPWFLGKVTFDLARQRGIEVGDLLSSVDAAGDDADQLAPMIDKVGRLVFVGLLPFEEGLEEADVTDLISVGELPGLVKAIMDPLQDIAEDEAGKARAEAAKKAQGKADRRKGRA